MYIFHWRAFATSRFDAGLVRPDGSARPSLAALARDLTSFSARWSRRRHREGVRHPRVRQRANAALSRAPSPAPHPRDGAVGHPGRQRPSDLGQD